jgi:hypothetical protein
MFGFIGILVGIVFILMGGFLVLFFPGAGEHQPPTFSIMGVIIGFILIVAGVILIFW